MSTPAGYGTPAATATPTEHVRGANLSPSGCAAVDALELREKFGLPYAASLARELAALVEPTATRADKVGTYMYRVRWRGPSWLPSTATRVRIFARPGDAIAAVWKLEERGYVAELSRAERGPWRVRFPATFSTAGIGEVAR